MRSIRSVALRSLSAGGAAWSCARFVERRPGREGVCAPRALPLFGSAGALCCQASPVGAPDRWAYNSGYRGELTPPRPQQAASEAVVLHGGSFGSRWLRVCPGAGPGDVTKALLEAGDGAKSAIYVGVPDDHESSGPIVAELRRRGFKFHHSYAAQGGGSAPAGELIYYRWVGKGNDMVPSYSTALEGIGVLVLSPDSKEVLLVWEYGHWKMITGNVDAGEAVTFTAKREVQEEVGLVLEDKMTLVGGWQEAKSRDQLVNNAFYVFLAHAKTKDAKVDNVEISQAQWFPLSALPSLVEEQKAPSVDGKPFGMAWDMGHPGKALISRTVVRFLETYHTDRGLTVKFGKGQDNPLEKRDLFL